MAWSQLHVSEINVILISFGLFMMTFMLTSKVTQSRLHIGAANVAFIAGIIFGPQAASLLDPLSWRRVDTIIMEVSRIVLIAQCFANGVELPNFYLKRHWRSLVWILGPAMVYGWLISTCCVKMMIPSLGWRQALACAACFNAIDPILAATALQSGSFYKRVPVHLRHLLRAEAGCNGITTTLVLDLAIYLIRYRNSPKDVASTTLILGLAYDIVLSAIIGAGLGFLARRLLWYCNKRGLVDRPAFLSLYLALAVFCAGAGSIVGTDDVLLSFFAGYFLDYDGQYQEYTENAKMSETIDLLLNLTYFVFIGSIIPWSSFHSDVLLTQPWRLVIGTLLLFIFRRLPVFSVLKPFIPDLKTYREATFYAHFGPIGGGAIFAALLIRAQLTPGSDKSASEPARNADTERFLSRLWTITTFVVLCSSLIHGSSIALFTFGKKLNAISIVLEDVYEAEDGEEKTVNDGLAAKKKIPEIFLDPPIDDENTMDPAQATAARRRRKKNLRAIENILHDLEDGHRIVVEDGAGAQIKSYTVRRPSYVAQDADEVSISSSLIDQGHWIRPESRRPSTQWLPSYVRRYSEKFSKEDKGKSPVR